MHVDVAELRNFYARPLGGVVRRIVARRLRSKWSNVSGAMMVGIGFAPPFLGLFRSQAERILALMPAGQGSIAWPSDERRRCALISESALPLPTDSADLVLLAHVVETSEEVPTLLREVWRILKPEGRVIVIVPNRRGVWARLETTPFGHGRPYTRGQLERLLARSMYEPTAWSTALFFPPLHNALLLRGALAWERLGSMAWPAFAGVNIVEARKTVGAPLVIPVKKAALIPGLGPAAVPVRAPARTPARA